MVKKVKLCGLKDAEKRPVKLIVWPIIDIKRDVWRQVYGIFAIAAWMLAAYYGTDYYKAHNSHDFSDSVNKQITAASLIFSAATSPFPQSWCYLKMFRCWKQQASYSFLSDVHKGLSAFIHSWKGLGFYTAMIGSGALFAYMSMIHQPEYVAWFVLALSEVIVLSTFSMNSPWQSLKNGCGSLGACFRKCACSCSASNGRRTQQLHSVSVISPSGDPATHLLPKTAQITQRSHPATVAGSHASSSGRASLLQAYDMHGDSEHRFVDIGDVHKVPVTLHRAGDGTFFARLTSPPAAWQGPTNIPCRETVEERFQVYELTERGQQYIDIGEYTQVPVSASEGASGGYVARITGVPAGYIHSLDSFTRELGLTDNTVPCCGNIETRAAASVPSRPFHLGHQEYSLPMAAPGYQPPVRR